MATFADVVSFFKKHRCSGLYRLIVRKLKDRFQLYVYKHTKEVLMEFDLKKNSVADRKPPPHIIIRQAEAADLDELNRINLENDWITDISQMIRWRSRGYPTFVAVDKNTKKIAGYTSVLLGPEMLNPKYVKKIGIGDDDAWIWDSFVLAEYRGGPIFWAILTEMLKSLKEKGFGRAFGTAEIKNRVSRVATTRVGFQETKLIRKINLFNRTIYVNSRPINSDLLNIKRSSPFRAG